MVEAAAEQPTFIATNRHGSRETFQVAAATQGPSHVIGRGLDASIRLSDIRVSRRHALLERTPDGWCVQDLGSRSGTRLDGRVLEAHESAPLLQGSVISVGPFDLRLNDGGTAGHSVSIRDDAAVSIVEPISRAELGSLASRRLEVLLKLAGLLNSTRELDDALERVAEALVAGTGYTRVAIVRESAAGCERLATCAKSRAAWYSPLSRSLLAAARTARAAVRMEDRGDLLNAASIAAADVSSALCIPIVAAGTDALSVQTVAYLDSPGEPLQPAADAAAFASAACDLAAMSMEAAERRALESEMTAMHHVQLQMMPPASVALGPYTAATQCVPGRGAAGDIIGRCSTAAGGTVLMVGDVSGKGPAAAMLMAATVSHLDASLGLGASLGEALANLNRHVVQRFEGLRFVTAALVHVSADGTMHACDLGHGIIFRVTADGSASVLPVNGGPPIGVDFEGGYEIDTLQLAPGERLVICSDGVIEQRSPAGAMFGFEGVVAALAGSPSADEDTHRLLTALREHAVHPTFDDDVTVVSVARHPEHLTRAG